ncbi:MAG: hypothetical protein ACD_78C00395G0001 [uncultured bacterium (gcode 4)]|uniref:Uncharacterized protein n=1 Tax=uncultured bacterium (gcode 4) TaxID=1234023 RepID=K1XGP5_9BACT|nr:MAG: hypothetical protein ACD_78C00395G0001 [uncultured bacterium (gcode 4)]
MAIGPDTEGDLYKLDSGIVEASLIEQGKVKPLTVVTGNGKDVWDSVDDLLQKIPEDHIVHNVPGNISASVKFLFFTWEKNNSGWIAKNLLSGDKNIRFYGSEVKISGTTVKQWVSLEKSAMPPVNTMPGNTFDEKRKNLELLLKTFDPPEEKKEN